ncbi:MAG: PaREP1 family protein, partial [Candidatus Njordarchaeota archaeon]
RNADKDVDVFIAELLSEKVDPKDRIKIYLALYTKFIREAEEFEKKKDFVQASEKYWGAITALLNIVGVEKNMPHYTHRDYWEIMNIIIDEMKDESLTELFALAEKLHANFYHNFIPEHQFTIYSKKARTLIMKLIEYLKKLGINIPEKN